MEQLVNVTLSYTGQWADEHEIDFYDVSQALIGFQRSLALTTHLVLNGEIITQAPSLQGARIFVLPAEPRCWQLTATIVAGVATAAYKLTTAPRDTTLGHLVFSAYDYLISESLGFRPDFDKSLGQQYEQARQTLPDLRNITPEKFDALAEKCEVAIKAMHRPIIESETANKAQITGQFASRLVSIPTALTAETYGYLSSSVRSDHAESFEGRIASYNMNTFKGRIYIPEENRPIPFELATDVRGLTEVGLVTTSLSLNARHRGRNTESSILIEAFRVVSTTGRLKLLIVVAAYSIDGLEDE